MQRKIKNTLFLILLSLAMGECRDPYTSPYKSPATGYLVVEGFIAGGGPTNFTLTRTVPLTGADSLPKVTGATLQVEGDDNSSYILPELGAGQYGGDTLSLNTVAKYRLRIHTPDNKDYLSDYVTFKQTPAIDSVNWTQDNSGVDIFVNTHDPANNTRYYQWEWVQTYHYTAAEYSSMKYVDHDPWVVDRPISEQIYDCWHTDISTEILLGSSAKLANDIIYRQQLTTIAEDSRPISVRYSLDVRQYALTENAYNYLSMMKKNTESLGSIFDAQPSYLKSNIHNVTDASEQVIGYISAGTVSEERIYINRNDLPIQWRYFFNCNEKDTIIKNIVDSLKISFSTGTNYIPLSPDFSFGGLVGYYANKAYCVDCRLQGGTTTKPSFWQD